MNKAALLWSSSVFSPRSSVSTMLAICSSMLSLTYTSSSQRSCALIAWSVTSPILCIRHFNCEMGAARRKTPRPAPSHGRRTTALTFSVWASRAPTLPSLSTCRQQAGGSLGCAHCNATAAPAPPPSPPGQALQWTAGPWLVAPAPRTGRPSSLLIRDRTRTLLAQHRFVAKMLGHMLAGMAGA